MKAILREPRKIVPMCIAALFFLTVFINNSPCIVKVVLYPAYRELRKEMFILRAKEFDTISTDSFQIYYKDIEQEQIEIIIDSAERGFSRVLSDFNHDIDGKIQLIVYPEYEEMANRIGLGNGCDAMGVYYTGVISILDPSKWIKNKGRAAEIFDRQGPMVHELTHYMIDYKSGGNVPIWFTEGAALYEEYRVNGVEWGSNKKYTDFYSIEELENSFYKLDEMKAYRQAFIIVKYIGNNFGMKVINDIIKLLGKGKTIDQAIKTVLNMDLKELFLEAYNYSE